MVPKKRLKVEPYGSRSRIDIRTEIERLKFKKFGED
jgi:hypothetical protein